jgi:hypothetical protein
MQIASDTNATALHLSNRSNAKAEILQKRQKTKGS